MTEELKNLQNGTPPKTRIESATALQAMVASIVQGDSVERAKKRSLVDGLIGGNPPFSPSKLRQLGRADACNVNWGTGKSYATQAQGIFYNLLSANPTQMSITVRHGKDSPRDDDKDISRKMSEIAHKVLNADPRWDFVLQMSQWNMVKHGTGPMWFEDPISVIPKHCDSGALKVPDNAKSEASYWEVAFILDSYKPHELYEKISNEAAGASSGWNVDYTKNAIMRASADNASQPNLDWEYYQRQFKQGSFASFYQSKVIKVAHCFWKEFDGRITHAIIEQSQQGADSPVGSQKEVSFLYRAIGKYGSWAECVHPLYYDRGDGTHYTVNGLGVAMYGAMVYENRLRCQIADGAMLPKVALKATSEGNQPFNMTQIGNILKVPAGYDMVPMVANGFIQDGLAMLNEVASVTSNNLAKYTQSWNRDRGNPPTAQQVTIEAQQQYAVAGTSISRYYAQMDVLFTEVVRRLCKSSDDVAKAFRKECKEEEIPESAFNNVVQVEANRASGQGSTSLQQMALGQLMQHLAMFPEDGREQIIRDFTASLAGYKAADRYYPKSQTDMMGTDQEAEAMQMVAGMKVGVPPVVTPRQNPVIYATTFIGAAGQAAGTLAQGASPVEVYQFLEIACPAAAAHIQRMAGDPTRKGIVKDLTDQLTKLAQFSEQLGAKIQEQQQQASEQQQQAGPQLPPEVQQKLMIQRAEGELKIELEAKSHSQRLKHRQEQHQMEALARMNSMQLDRTKADLEAANQIQISRAQAAAEIENSKKKAAAASKSDGA